MKNFYLGILCELKLYVLQYHQECENFTTTTRSILKNENKIVDGYINLR